MWGDFSNGPHMPSLSRLQNIFSNTELGKTQSRFLLSHFGKYMCLSLHNLHQLRITASIDEPSCQQCINMNV